MTSLIIPWKTVSSVLSVGLPTAGWNLAEAPCGYADVLRTFRAQVFYPEAFNSIPLVQASLTGFDIDQRDTARISVAVSDITTTGFTVSVTTWRETRVYGVEVTWTVIGN